jgi:hypothetical protein
MLLLIVFGIIAIVKKRVFITRGWKLTGDAAVQFGIALIAAPIGLASTSSTVLPYVVPSSILRHPIGGRLFIIAILAVVLLIVAFLLRDKPAQQADS